MDSLSIDSLRFPDLGGSSGYNFPSFGADSSGSMFSDLGSFKSVFDQLGVALSGYQQQGAANRLGITGTAKQEGETTVKGPDGKEYVMRGGRFVPATAAKPGVSAASPTIQGAMPTGDVASLQISGLGPNNRAEYFRRAMRIAQHLEGTTGIPAEVLAAIGASESNFGNTPGNAVFGIKAEPGRPSVTLNTPEGNAPGGSYTANLPFNAYATAYEAFQDFSGFLDRNPRYAAALASLRSGQSNADQFVQNINAQGYAEDQGWANRMIVPLMREAAQYRQQPAAPGGIRGVSQFDLGLPREVAEAFCSQAAVIAFANATGRNPNVMEVLNMSKEEGWTQSAGQAGPQAHINLLRRVGVPAYMGAPDANKIAQEVMAGRPVVIDTPGHYYQVTGYNQATGTFTFGDSVGAKAGNVGVSLADLGRFGFGAARTAIFLGQ